MSVTPIFLLFLIPLREEIDLIQARQNREDGESQEDRAIMKRDAEVVS
jgi:hypothetical protein